jgi:hypothetical protein
MDGLAGARQDVCTTVGAMSGDERSVRNLAQTSLHAATSPVTTVPSASSARPHPSRVAAAALRSDDRDLPKAGIIPDG